MASILRFYQRPNFSDESGHSTIHTKASVVFEIIARV